MVNIVISRDSLNYFKSSKYFKINLGLAITIEKGGKRKLNEDDNFSLRYNLAYSTNIFAQGNIGNIKIYTNIKFTGNTIVIYYGPTYEEFPYTLDLKLIKEKGMDHYLGVLLKEVEEKHNQLLEDNKIRKEAKAKIKGDANMITNNPGNVTYDDIKAYLNKKRSKI
jgi:hypothetical protein